MENPKIYYRFFNKGVFVLKHGDPKEKALA
jgi:hypothetical protein